MIRLSFEVQLVCDLKECSEERLLKNTAYVLGVFLEDYSTYIGRPKIGAVRVLKDGKLIAEDQADHKGDR